MEMIQSLSPIAIVGYRGTKFLILTVNSNTREAGFQRPFSFDSTFPSTFFSFHF